MLRYVARRVLLILPTLIGIVTINFLIVQFVPGGPVDQAIMRAMGQEFSVRRDYPIVIGSLFCFTFVGLAMTLIGDIAYTLVDPRIDFEARDT